MEAKIAELLPLQVHSFTLMVIRTILAVATLLKAVNNTPTLLKLQRPLINMVFTKGLHGLVTKSTVCEILDLLLLLVQALGNEKAKFCTFIIHY